mgnify:CR=1 FL=1
MLVTQTTILRRRLIGKGIQTECSLYADDDIAAAIDRQIGIQTREKMVGVLCGTGTVVV